MEADIDLPGFADPVHGSQASFRALLSAMSRPGSLHTLGAALTPPAGLDQATAAVLLTLIDNETTLWLDPRLAAARGWIGFHCGATVAPTPEQAGFVLAIDWPELGALATGTDEGPEDAATVICQLAALGDGPAYRLSGPGLAATAILRVRGLPADFVAVWQRNHALYPRGVDLVLCAGTTLAALPRSVHIEAG